MEFDQTTLNLDLANLHLRVHLLIEVHDGRSEDHGNRSANREKIATSRLFWDSTENGYRTAVGRRKQRNALNNFTIVR